MSAVALSLCRSHAEVAKMERSPQQSPQQLLKRLVALLKRLVGHLEMVAPLHGLSAKL